MLACYKKTSLPASPRKAVQQINVWWIKRSFLQIPW